jgi:hypothetical protein
MIAAKITRVDGAPPLLGPVDVLEVKPEGELVERQAHADSEDRREDLEPGIVRLSDDPDEAREHHRDDPEDEVMDVHAARGHVPGPPGDLRPDHPGAEPDKAEGEQHRRETDKARTLTLRVERCPAVDLEVERG